MTKTIHLPQGEFIALLALMFATVALSIDAMLPALPQIAQSLSPQVPNKAQLVITAFVFGMGIGTLFAGPLSDRYGRKPVVLLGLILYAAGSLLCYLAPSLDMLLAARVLQGLGVAAPRTVSMAIVRDIYSGREMARIVSFAQMIFTTIPAMAPFMGLGMIWLAGWQSIFLAYLVFAALCAAWFGLRQPETLPAPARRSLSPRDLIAATKEMFNHPGTAASILVQSLTLGMLFGTLSSIQGIYDQQFGRGDSFAYWFALVALVSMGGSYINSRVVMTMGMQRVLVMTYLAQMILSACTLVLINFGPLPEAWSFGLLILWQIGMFAMMGTTMGNLIALALEPLGHISGLASSVMSCIATVASVCLAVPVGLMFDGTSLPLISSVTLLAGLAFALSKYALKAAKT